MRCPWCPAPTTGHPLCDECRWLARQELAALPSDYRDLAALAPPGTRRSVRVSGTRAPSVPLDLTADALMREITWQLGTWEPPVREAAGLPPAPETGVRPARLVHRAAGLLSSHVDAFSRLGPTWGYPLGPTRGCVARSGLYGLARLRRAHALTLSVLDLAPPPATLVPGLCPRCRAPALTATPGTPGIHCAHCTEAITVDQYQNAVLITTPTPITQTSETPPPIPGNTPTPM